MATQYTSDGYKIAPTSPRTELFQRAAEQAAEQADIHEQAMQARMQQPDQQSTQAGAQSSAAKSAETLTAECPTTDALSAIFNNVRCGGV